MQASPSKCAADGWHKTALHIEQAITNKQLVAGGSIDVFKCFEHVNRELIYLLAQRAGMPSRNLTAYKSYLEGMEIHFQVGKAIGVQHKDRASIPQGCPFSMAMVALLTKPWLSVMHNAHVIVN